MLLSPGWHKMRIQAVVDIEAYLVFVIVEQDHQFHLLLGMIEKTTCLMLHLEQMGDKDVIIAML